MTPFDNALLHTLSGAVVGGALTYIGWVVASEVGRFTKWRKAKRKKMAEPWSPRAGEVVADNFRIVRELGRGAYGVVYLADDLALERKVAVKVSLAGVGAPPNEAALFRREARLLAAVRHEGVVTVHALGEHRGMPFVVMEYLEDVALNWCLSAVLKLSLVRDTARQLCSAVQAVHDAGIIHCDIKPANVVMSGSRAVLTDFGLAKMFSPGSSKTLSGTPDYLAPELVRRSPCTLDEAKRADVYALGMTVYELVTGRLPYSSCESGEVLRRHCEEDPSPPSTFRPEVPELLDEVILKAIARDPRERYQTASEFGVALEDAFRAEAQTDE